MYMCTCIYMYIEVSLRVYIWILNSEHLENTENSVHGKCCKNGNIHIENNLEALWQDFCTTFTHFYSKVFIAVTVDAK